MMTDPRRPSWPYALIVAACVGLVYAYAHAGAWPRTHELLRYLELAEHFARAVRDGDPWPRWLPNLTGGYGYPTFVFYQPLLFFLYVPCRLLMPDPVSAMWAVVAILLTLGGIGSYRLFGREVRAGLFGAALFLLTPYLYVDWLVRGDLSELMAMCLVPWTLSFLRDLARNWHGQGSSLSWLGLVVSGAGVLLAHPIIALLLAPSLALIGLSVSVHRRTLDWPLLLRIAGAGVAIVLLTTPYWQPLVTLRSSSSLQAAFEDYFIPLKHTVHWPQFFGGPWQFGGSKPYPEPDEMSFELGRPHIALALSGALLGRKLPFLRGAALAYALSVVAMTPAMDFIWRWPILSDMQFPWRLLCVTAGLQVALCTGWIPVLERLGASVGRRELTALGCLVLLSAAWRPEQFGLDGEYANPQALVQHNVDTARERLANFANKNEFLPATVQTMPRAPLGGRPLVEGPAEVVISPLADHSPTHLAVRVSAPGPAELVINQFYFPGWRVEVDDREVPPSELESLLRPDGLIRVVLRPAPGRTRILRAHYHGPPGLWIRVTGVALAAAAFALVRVLERRRRTRAA